jgi:hypothetical protein
VPHGLAVALIARPGQPIDSDAAHRDTTAVGWSVPHNTRTRGQS